MVRALVRELVRDDNLMNSRSAWCFAALLAIACSDVAPPAEQPPASEAISGWGTRVGAVRDDDTTTWCVSSIVDVRGASVGRAMLRTTALDGTSIDNVTSTTLMQRTRVQCFRDATHTDDTAGDSVVQTSLWSTDARGDVVDTEPCPSTHPVAAYASCQLAATTTQPFVVAGSACGDGVISATPGEIRGQLTGATYELTGTEIKPLFNNTVESAKVGGTDLGFPFLAQGTLYFGFGDTWENNFKWPGAEGYRSNTLAFTHDMDPSDDNGIAFDGWVTAPETPQVAREVIFCPHNDTEEFTAIPSGGFGLTEGGHSYLFLWFVSIKGWVPFDSTHTTLAWSIDGGEFIRGDKQDIVPAPIWPGDSLISNGGIWVDREGGHIYFVGVNAEVANQPVRLARVRGLVSAVLDRTRYEYWNGETWTRDEDGDYAEASRDLWPIGSAADIIPGDNASRPELSLAFNAHANRFLLGIRTYYRRTQMWQAARITGPWELVTDALSDATSPHYAPYFSEHLMTNDGADIYYTQSDWNGVPGALGQPYNVGLMKTTITRATLPGCVP